MQVYGADVLSAMANEVNARLSLAGTARDSVAKLVAVDGNIFAAWSPTEDGLTGSILIPVAGVPVRISWVITPSSAPLPAFKASITLQAFVGNVMFKEVTISVDCQDVTQPSTCTSDITEVSRSTTGTRGCNKTCLKRCAPGCIYCGSDWWCWAACTAVCYARCC